LTKKLHHRQILNFHDSVVIRIHLTRKNYKILLTQTHIALGQICCHDEKLLLMDKLNNMC